jgi:hypothetical protein
VPIWAAVVIGLGSGLLSGLVGTFATITHERGAEFRTRMLSAAENFIHVAEGVRQAVRVCRADLSDETYRTLEQRFDDLVPAVTLVELLYGHASATAVAARYVGSAVIDVRSALSIGPDRWDDESVDAAMNEFNTGIVSFGDEAARQVRHRWRSRLRATRRLRSLGMPN